jgi:hypothetical protein
VKINISNKLNNKIYLYIIYMVHLDELLENRKFTGTSRNRSRKLTRENIKRN